MPLLLATIDYSHQSSINDNNWLEKLENVTKQCLCITHRKASGLQSPSCSFKMNKWWMWHPLWVFVRIWEAFRFWEQYGRWSLLSPLKKRVQITSWGDGTAKVNLIKGTSKPGTFNGCILYHLTTLGTQLDPRKQKQNTLMFSLPMPKMPRIKNWWNIRWGSVMQTKHKDMYVWRLFDIWEGKTRMNLLSKRWRQTNFIKQKTIAINVHPQS